MGPTGQTAQQIFTLDGSNDADSCKGVLVLAFVGIEAHLGDQIVKKQFWGVNRHFPVKRAKYRNVNIIKTTASIITKFCTVIQTPKYSVCGANVHQTNPRWRTAAIFKKSKNLNIFATN